MRRPIPVEANARNLELAREALKSCLTRLENAANRTSMDQSTREDLGVIRTSLSTYLADIDSLTARANQHMADMRAKRGAT